MCKSHRVCHECGNPLPESYRPEIRFCGSGCKARWNNRRRQRGAELYDLFMATRYERGLAKALGLWALMCRMAQDWREEDVAERGGRRSYTDPQTAKERAGIHNTHRSRV